MKPTPPATQGRSSLLTRSISERRSFYTRQEVKTPISIHRGDASFRPPAGEKPVRNSIELVGPAPPQPPAIHAPKLLLETIANRQAQSQKDLRNYPEHFRITSRNLMHPFFSNPLAYHEQTVKNRAKNKTRVRDIRDALKAKNPIQPLSHFNEEYDRDTRHIPFNNSAYGNFYQGQHSLGFYIPGETPREPFHKTVTISNYSPELDQQELEKGGTQVYDFIDLMKQKAHAYLESKRSMSPIPSPLSFEETARRSLNVTGWRRTREQDQHSFLSTTCRQFTTPKLKGEQSRTGLKMTRNSSNQNRLWTIEDPGLTSRRKNGWESPIGAKREYVRERVTLEQHDAVQTRPREKEDIKRMEDADLPRRFKRLLNLREFKFKNMNQVREIQFSEGNEHTSYIPEDGSRFNTPHHPARNELMNMSSQNSITMGESAVHPQTSLITRGPLISQSSGYSPQPGLRTQPQISLMHNTPSIINPTHPSQLSYIPEADTQIHLHEGIPSQSARSGLVTRFPPRVTMFAGKYEKLHYMELRTGNTEDKIIPLNIKIYVAAGSDQLQVLVIQIYDQVNPNFLYILEVGEREYHPLKQQQNINVDFKEFPTQLVSLLENCDDGSNRFSCVLCTGYSGCAEFNIVEKNAFKQINHLGLKFRKANQGDIIRFISEKMKGYKTYSETLKKELSETRTCLDNTRQEAQQMRQSNEELKLNQDRMRQSYQNQKEKELNDQREALMRDYQEKIQRQEETALEMRTRLDQDKGDLTSALNKAKEELDMVKEERMTLASSERELKSKLERISHELELKTEEVNVLREEKKRISAIQLQQEKELTGLSVKLEGLNKQLDDREIMVSQGAGLLEETKRSQQQLQENNKILKANNEKIEQKLNQGKEEIIKGNAIIARLQGDMKVQKNKLRQKAQVLASQEAVIENSNRRIEELQRQNNDITRDVEMKSQSMRSLEETIQEMKEKLEQNEKTLTQSKNMIAWLNSQLSAAQKAGLSSFTSTMRASSPMVSFQPAVGTLEPDSAPKGGYSSYKYGAGLSAVMQSSTGSFKMAANQNETPNSLAKPQGRYYVSKYSSMNHVQMSEPKMATKEHDAFVTTSASRFGSGVKPCNEMFASHDATVKVTEESGGVIPIKYQQPDS